MVVEKLFEIIVVDVSVYIVFVIVSAHVVNILLN